LSNDQFVRVASLAELREGRMRSCKVGDREIVLCPTREGLFAVDNICTHAEARLSEGRLKGVRVICPMHGASFDVRDGRVLASPATQPLTTHTVRIVDGAVEVAVRVSLSDR